MTDTIFALSSGAPPAAIAVIRISGPGACTVVRQLAGPLPEARRAAYRQICASDGSILDRGLVLWFPGPGSVTGEDLVEFHLHGGRAVVAAVEAELAARPKLRRATPGEFTQRAFANGKIDLSEAEGLADLLEAETELQRKCAIAMAGGALSQVVEDWREHLLALSASVEAVLDFADEDDVALLPPDFEDRLEALRRQIREWLDRPRATRLKEGFRVVLAGPPNSGKSRLFNALVQDEAAIVADIAGTTRDVISRPVGIDGIPLVFFDTAGLRSETDDMIEAIGMERARGALDDADLVLWLGSEGGGPAGAWEIEPQCDRADRKVKASPRHRVSAVTGEGIEVLHRDLADTARHAMPKSGDAALNDRQHRLLHEAEEALGEARSLRDPLLVAECFRRARLSFDALSGRATTEDMLDALFGRFCIGK